MKIRVDPQATGSCRREQPHGARSRKRTFEPWEWDVRAQRLLGGTLRAVGRGPRRRRRGEGRRVTRWPGLLANNPG